MSVCVNCSAEFEPVRRVGRPSMYCSQECRRNGQRAARNAAAREKYRLDGPRGRTSPCARCGKKCGNHRGNESVVCHDCRRAKAAPYGPRKIPEQRICVLCDQPYVLKRGNRPDQRWCSKSCAQAWRNGARPPYTRPVDDQGTTRASRKRRRLAVRAATWDGVTDEQILERDRWRCGICGKQIGKSYKHPHPRSKSIDHIIPLSLGGDDTAANKRAAHLACNCGRMNRADWEQVALIG